MAQLGPDKEREPPAPVGRTSAPLKQPRAILEVLRATKSHPSADRVFQRVFGTFITWLQEKGEPVFVIATANRIAELPPELLRRGRFDEIFFVDLPRGPEREEIFRIHIRKRGRDPSGFDVARLAGESRGFSGAEIEQAVVAAMYQAFPENREMTTEDISTALAETVPLAQLAREQVDALRRWARDRARPATLGEPEQLP